MNTCPDGHCLTCADELVPVRVRAVSAETTLALVDKDGQRQEIDISLVESVAPGDVLLVHSGVALARESEDGKHAC